ncbi:hypothetical protein AB4Y30_17070 [Ornithinibacillus sp. 4-3]|uniref:Uncharacterized protein n=1 Tax=Ornithinibacillus sp. 4-3 TaxID=3231488 RepID=A0AB39HMT9_9BACI
MENFLQVCEDTEKRLHRKLQKEELQFLQWMCERYAEEQQKNEKMCGVQ